MPVQIDIGDIKVDAHEIVRQLKHDLIDDWFPDSLGYEDLLEPETIAEAVRAVIDENDGLFQPEPRGEFNIPKKGFTLRCALETGVLDRAYYHTLVRHLAPFYDELLPNNVLSHRYAGTGDRAGRYLFRHPIEQWKLFRGFVAAEARDKPVVVLTDVQNYYENIQVELLGTILRDCVPKLRIDGAEKARVRTVIEQLQRCLGSWCYRGTHGLPQNRDASSFLANLVMLPVDDKMLRSGYVYFRYMDDIRIATPSKYKGRAALQDLIVELRKMGLNVNSSKTEILVPGDPDYERKVFQRESELEQIDIMWQSRSLPVIRRSFEPLKQFALKLIAAKRLEEPAFRFCVTRFEKLARCPEIEVPAEYFSPLVDAAIVELDNQPHSADQIVRFLKAAPLTQEQVQQVAEFLRDRERAIYDWQNYLLWQLLVYKAHRDDVILALAREKCRQSRLAADRAGAMLYLGAMGTEEDRLALAASFEDCRHHLLQRNGIIAVHELDYASGIKQNVAPYVLPSLKGSYKRIRNRFMGCYHRPLPSVSYLDIYDEVSSYE